MPEFLKRFLKYIQKETKSKKKIMFAEISIKINKTQFYLAT